MSTEVQGVGRPSDVTGKVMEEVCDLLSDGKSLVDICSENNNLPSRRAILRAVACNEEFRHMYRAAREAQADYFVDDTIAIADDISEDPQSRSIRIRTRQWAASKMAPRVYGELIRTETETKNVDKFSSEEDVDKVLREHGIDPDSIG